MQNLDAALVAACLPEGTMAVRAGTAAMSRVAGSVPAVPVRTSDGKPMGHPIIVFKGFRPARLAPGGSPGGVVGCCFFQI